MAKPRTLEAFLAGLDVVALSHQAKILFVAYFTRLKGRTDFSANELDGEFRQGHLPPPPNLPVRLAQLAQGKLAPLIRLRPGRYSLSIYGVREVEDYIKAKPGTAAAAEHLEKLVGRLSEKARQRFLAEAIACLQVGARRTAVIMTWILAADHLQEYILRNHLAAYNTALARRPDTRGLHITTRDDFSELKEVVFIEVARSAGIITNDVRKILDEKLGIRNTAAHPSDVEIHETKVINVVEDLVENVILKYPL